MRRPLIALVATAALVASTFGAATAAQAAPPQPTKYLALGDSYPAGTGLNPAQAYPALLAQQTPRTDVDNNAVSGATTGGVASSQITGGNDVITLTVGANDLGWIPTLVGCQQFPSGCQAGISTALAKIPDMATGVAADVQAARTVNPGAEIYVTGYPVLFADLAPTETCDIGGPQPVLGAQTALINQAVVNINTAINAAATDSGATYVDASSRFTNHRLCDPSPWIQDLTDGAPLHPTANGQKAYAKAIAQSGFRALATQPVAAGRS